MWANSWIKHAECKTNDEKRKNGTRKRDTRRGRWRTGVKIYRTNFDISQNLIDCRLTSKFMHHWIQHDSKCLQCCVCYQLYPPKRPFIMYKILVNMKVKYRAKIACVSSGKSKQRRTISKKERKNERKKDHGSCLWYRKFNSSRSE